MQIVLTSIGAFEVTKAGYYALKLTNKNPLAKVTIPQILIGGSATEGKVYYAKEDFFGVVEDHPFILPISS